MKRLSRFTWPLIVSAMLIGAAATEVRSQTIDRNGDAMRTDRGNDMDFGWLGLIGLAGLLGLRGRERTRVYPAQPGTTRPA